MTADVQGKEQNYILDIVAVRTIFDHVNVS
jgi:hypothetical protein